MQLQSGPVRILLEWAVAALAYPGLLFGVALTMVGEWVVTALRPLLTRRIYRFHSRPRHFFQPMYDFLKLAGRRWTMDGRCSIRP